MPSSKMTIPAIKAAVAEVLKGAAGLEEIPIETGPREPETAKEWIFLWKARAKRKPGSLGRAPFALDEDVTLTVRVCSIHEESEARVFVLAEAVESALQAEPTLDGVVRWQYVEEVDQVAMKFDEKDGHRILLTIVAKSRIN
jgi:hypothetical protein